MAVNIEQLTKTLSLKFKTSNIELLDTTGDGHHLELYIESELFDGVSKVKQHKMIYEAIQDFMPEIHAISIKSSSKSKSI